MILKEESGQLLVSDDAGLLGARTFNPSRPSDTGIVYCNYIPIQLTEEEWEKHEKMSRAGKTYAKVKRSNPNPAYRCKRGQVVNKGPTGYCLEIETVNRTNENGCSTLIGVTYPHGYKKIWFDHDEVEDFETYDENGELKK
jgi:hypothetical protein